jgi:hypothetical protein
MRESFASNLIALDLWREQLGKAAPTIWRWRRRGWIKVVNICGRNYIDRREIAEFERRAAAGEFSKVHKTPTRKAGLQ